MTIAIFAIIAAIAAPSMGQLLVKQNLNKSTKELIHVLTEARSKAALDRKPIKVGFDPSVTDADLNWMPSGKSDLKPSSPTNITFLPTGLVDGWTLTNSSFTVCEQNSGSLSKTVSISKMGTIQQVVEGTCS
ncbi:GspH/FimT family pseudopilin [Acinetobacter junii]